ncbi:MAG: LysR family transcriptional regulator [Capsulimonadales bacterium]|nr:LysR family transcriptional regulator [Capsulimonadales bacterium]
MLYEKIRFETPMELHQLEAFEAVVLHRSFTRAADALCLTQPAVTRQIAALETELRTRLFDRLGRSVRLTASGEVLHRYAEPVLRLVREARDAVTDTEAGTGGRLTVGASSTLATYVLPPLLRRFRETYPLVEIGISTGVSAHILEMVREGSADVGLITTEAGPPGPGLVVTLLTDYETGVVVPPVHPLAGRERVSAAELGPYPLILMESGTNLRAFADGILESGGVRGQIAMELDNVEAIKRMIESGLGISLLPTVAVRAEVVSERLVALPLAEAPRGQRRIALVYRRDKYLSGPLQAFLERIRQDVGAGRI